MIQFNELRITPDNNCLIIDIEIPNINIYKDVFIDSVIIDNQDTYVDNGPSSNPVYKYTIEESTTQKVYSSTGECAPVKEDETKEECLVEKSLNTKTLRLVLDSQDVALANNILFVYAIAKGTPDPSTPCGMDNMTTIGVVTNMRNIFQQMMPYIREIEGNCAIPKNFIDKILRFNALKLSISTGNYTLAIKYWNKYFKNESAVQPPSICNCYGRTR